MLKYSFTVLLMVCLLGLVACGDQGSKNGSENEIGLSNEGTSSENEFTADATCGSDQTISRQLAREWIEEGWQANFPVLGLGSEQNGEKIKFGGFFYPQITSLVRQCDDCPYFNISFAIPDHENMIPYSVMMNVDAECALVTQGDTAAMLSTVNRNNGSPKSGPLDYETASTYISNWKNDYVFPDGYKTVYSYTYVRDSVLQVMDSCLNQCPDMVPMLRATYAVHPDTLGGNDNQDSLLMDIIFTCDCADTDSIYFSGDFVDIANPCPPICPNQ